MAYFTRKINTLLALQAWNTTAPQPLVVTVSAQRAATLSNIPAGSAAADYEYQFRPGPAISPARVVDMSQTLAAGESATDYETQLR